MRVSRLLETPSIKELIMHKKHCFRQHAFYRETIQAIDAFSKEVLRAEGRIHMSVKEGVIHLDREEPLSPSMKASCERLISRLIPWRKGPYSLFGNVIHSEWNSHIKWAHLSQALPSLDGKVVCDLGANNGYFMFRMKAYKPKAIMGMEPAMQYNLQYRWIQSLLSQEGVFYEPLGYEDLAAFKGIFDLIMCLGILYHHTDPILILKKMHNALSKGGQLIVECQGISAEGSYALFPRRRYAGAKGMWYLPTRACLENWCYRAGYRDVEVFHRHVLQTKEQRTTMHSPYPSLKEGLKQSDRQETIEGYPAPVRYYLKAFKG